LKFDRPFFGVPDMKNKHLLKAYFGIKCRKQINNADLRHEKKTMLDNHCL